MLCVNAGDGGYQWGHYREPYLQGGSHTSVLSRRTTVVVPSPLCLAQRNRGSRRVMPTRRGGCSRVRRVAKSDARGRASAARAWRRRQPPPSPRRRPPSLTSVARRLRRRHQRAPARCPLSSTVPTEEQRHVQRRCFHHVCVGAIAASSAPAAVAKLSTQSSYPGRLLLPRQRIDWSGIESSQAQNKELYGYTRRSKLGCSLHWGATDGTGSQLRKPRFTCTSRPTGKRERIGRLCSGPALRKLSVQTCIP